uniref:Uncharacterized protein n=1 Tax=Oryza brachyantha TaxID=4533 RepID=J3N7X3_ORYBR
MKVYMLTLMIVSYFDVENFDAQNLLEFDLLMWRILMHKGKLTQLQHQVVDLVLWYLMESQGGECDSFKHHSEGAPCQKSLTDTCQPYCARKSIPKE